MAAYERARDEQIEKNLAMLESLGIKDLLASLPALYRSSQRKGTKKRKSKVAIGNDEEFLPPPCEESFGYSSDDCSGSQAEKARDQFCLVFMDSQGDQFCLCFAAAFSCNGFCCCLLIAVMATVNCCCCFLWILFCCCFVCSPALLSASFWSRKCNPVVELPTLVARLHGRLILSAGPSWWFIAVLAFQWLQSCQTETYYAPFLLQILDYRILS
ncbi:hypothetical protein RHGRI_015630 [Rhododendron griersonianum]|uniref:Uncharacterized protein n=1 Tax=Rhododendron griersonianum TaxID=479676 RepID=A0AAV6KEK2_9ERIC|nr:hypothetical protein RHGRI_015630 [Rhododendron griersonianum]